MRNLLLAVFTVLILPAACALSGQARTPLCTSDLECELMFNLEMK